MRKFCLSCLIQLHKDQWASERRSAHQSLHTKKNWLFFVISNSFTVIISLTPRHDKQEWNRNSSAHSKSKCLSLKNTSILFLFSIHKMLSEYRWKPLPMPLLWVLSHNSTYDMKQFPWATAVPWDPVYFDWWSAASRLQYDCSHDHLLCSVNCFQWSAQLHNYNHVCKCKQWFHKKGRPLKI